MFHISGFYKFKRIKNIKKTKELLNNFFTKHGIRGTVIISLEGINGTISSKKKELQLALLKIKKIFNISKFDSQNFAINKFQIFQRGKVKIKKEVVPMGLKITKRNTKHHIEPSKWNILIANKKQF